MRLCFVTPKNPPSFWTYDSILGTLGKRCLCPNLSMPTVAGLTPDGHDIVLFDENVQEIDFDIDADIIGITGYIVHAERMLEIIDEFKARGKFVIVGGPYATLCPEKLRDRVDVLFKGEAEETWAGFLEDFERGDFKSEYEAPELPEMTNAPPPRFDLMDVPKYQVMAIQFARGCPFQCEFCDIIVMYGRKPRMKAVERVIAEIEEVHRLGATQVFVVDDNFIGNRTVAKELLRAIIVWQEAHGFPLAFNTETSLNVAQDAELLQLLSDARFVSIFIGIESPRVASLEETGKVQNTIGDLVEAVHEVQSYGIDVQAGMIVGFDNDDASIFEEQSRFIQAARISVSMTGMLQALPETPLRARVQAEGRLITESGGDQFLFSNILPSAMTQLELYRGYRDLVAKLYTKSAFLERASAYLLGFGSKAMIPRAMQPGRLGFLWRIARDTLLLGGPSRAWFTLRLVLGTLVRRPAALHQAVALAVIHVGLSDYADSLQEPLARAIESLERELETEGAADAAQDDRRLNVASTSARPAANMAQQ